MKRLIFIATVLLSSYSVFSQQKPNVILIVSDDQGTLDTNIYGSSDLSTPSLDQLAQQGVRFTQFYAASAVCSPSRAALLTGRYPHRAGVPNNAESHPTKFGSGHGLQEEQVTIAELLKDAGYRTGLFGKWHLGTIPGPNAQGFDQAVGFLGGCIDKWSHINYGQAPWGKDKWHDWYRNGVEEWAAGRHSGDLIVEEAIQFMAASEQPFFVYAAFGSPHYTLNPYNKHMQQFQHLQEPRRTYAAMMATLDEQIGRLLQAVEESGESDNTIVIFQSDHGHSTEARNNYGGGNAGHLRGAKAGFFEGGIRVPAMISWPGHVPKNESRDQFAVACDWLPTILELCGIEQPEHKIDGASLAGVIQENSEAQHEEWHWALSKQWAARKGEWKLLYNAIDKTDGHNHFRVPGFFLTNLAQDESERTNFAEENPGIVKELSALHEVWLEDVKN
jgi:arylsulfatase A